VLFWGSRLTYNWIRRWKGLQDEDWRYVNFRKKFPRSYWIVSLFGIHLLPTITVFLACLSIYPAIVFKPDSLDLFDLVAIGVTLCAILIETIADEQLRKFLLRPTGQSFLSSGLWKYSRHPNYFGEVLFWFGLFLFSYESGSFYWWTLPGPFGMVALFLFVSVPMIDKRMLQRKEGYATYMRNTSGLVLWFVKKIE
jgi:steroid 5-alpha reductase family enzyme